MKKLTLFAMLLATFIFSITAPSYATKYDWSDHNFNFKAVHQVMVANLSTARVNLDSDIEARTLNDDYLQKASKLNFRKVVYSTMPQNQISAAPQDVTSAGMSAVSQAKRTALQKEALANHSDIFIVARLNKYKIGKKLIPAHTEWKEKEETRTVYDRDGKSHEETERIEYPEQIPDTYQKNAMVEVFFDTYSTDTGKVIFSRQESRTRTDSDDPEGVYKRIVSSFFDSMKNLLKKNKI